MNKIQMRQLEKWKIDMNKCKVFMITFLCITLLIKSGVSQVNSELVTMWNNEKSNNLSVVGDFLFLHDLDTICLNSTIELHKSSSQLIISILMDSLGLKIDTQTILVLERLHESPSIGLDVFIGIENKDSIDIVKMEYGNNTVRLTKKDKCHSKDCEKMILELVLSNLNSRSCLLYHSAVYSVLSRGRVAKCVPLFHGFDELIFDSLIEANLSPPLPAASQRVVGKKR